MEAGQPQEEGQLVLAKNSKLGCMVELSYLLYKTVNITIFCHNINDRQLTSITYRCL